jgi:hypothetical protein
VSQDATVPIAASSQIQGTTHMKPRISLITLGVDDLEASLRL